ncbi:MAG: HAD hydrolase-like protein [Candidatus Nealsonbacteria bacterium]|nr:HAD hydrolase-like protein [Candidatus Nealsonbacteria bacterium]
MTRDAIIFDIDGTLWNVSEAVAKGWGKSLKPFGINTEVSAKDIESVMGHPTEICIDLLLPGAREKNPGLKNALENCEIEAIKSHGAAFYEGMAEGIRELAVSHKIFLVSNCQTSYLRLFLEASGLEPVFSGFDCFGMSGSPKDRMLAKMKKDYSLKYPVYVGDTAGDEKAAGLAGIDFIHAAYGFGLSKAAIRFCSFPALVRGFKKEVLKA